MPVPAGSREILGLGSESEVSLAPACELTLPGIPILLPGASDPIVPAGDPAWLAAQPMAASAEVTHRVLPVGHRLSAADVTAASAWLKGHAR